MRLEDGFEVRLFINNLEFPLSPGSFSYVRTIHNVLLGVPTFDLVFYDPTATIMNTMQIADGVPIVLTLGDANHLDQPPIQENFRVFGKPKTLPSPQGGATAYRVLGVIDAPKFLRKNPGKSYTGTSAQVITQLANETGLTSQISHNTADSMTWLPDRKSYATFAWSVALHGWADPQSLMVLSLDEFGGLRYANLSDISATVTPVATFFQGGDPTGYPKPWYMLTDWRQISKSGFNNYWIGYDLRTRQMKSDGTWQQFDQVNLTKTGGNVEVNADVYNQLQGAGRIDLMPVDCGNVHPNYFRAMHQNKRLKTFYSQGVQILINRCTSFNPLDPVQVIVLNQANSTIDDTIKGVYLITGRTREITGLTCWEKLSMTTSALAKNLPALLS